MEYLIGVIVALVGGLFFYKNKAKNAEVESRLAETKGKDSELVIQQDEVEDAIKAIDDGIEKMKAEKEAERQRRENMTLKERADAAKNRYKK